MRTTLLAVVIGAFAGWLAWHVVAAFRSGVANAHGFRYSQSERPTMFWLTVVGQIAFTLLFIYFLYLQLRT